MFFLFLFFFWKYVKNIYKNICNVVYTLKIITPNTLPNNPKILYNILKNVILLKYIEIVLHRLTFIMDSAIIIALFLIIQILLY